MPQCRPERRRLSIPLVSLLLLVLLAPAALAQGGGAPPAATELVKAGAEPVTIAAGGPGEVRVTLQIASGWHVNANPPSPDYLIPTTVTLPAAQGIAPGRVAYPKGRPVRLAFDSNPLSVYTGEVTIAVPVTAAASAAAGARTLKGQVRFQSCNDQVCLAPATVPFTVAVTVTGGSRPGATTAPAAPPSAKPQATAPPPPAGGAATPEGAPAVGAGLAAGAPEAAAGAGAATNEAGRRLAGAMARGGLWWFLALFVGGLALNLTPCVFPMLGITVSVFGARRKERAAKVVAHAVAYVIGIAVTYSVLGVVAALTGGLFGSALQNPWVNVGLGVLFVLLALSMFGLYEMQPPAWMLARLGGADTTSIVGIFLSGLAVGIIAAPCVGPFVVAVLALLAQRGDPLFGFQAMFTMSLGLGFPYLFLAIFSNLLQGLPRSGDWMLWVKKVFGVLLAGIGLYYVLIGFAPRVAEWVLPVVLAAGGVYLGFLDRHGAGRRGFVTLKRALGTVALLAGIAFAWKMQSEGVRFQPYDETAVRAAMAAGRPVMIDFSADWCIPCHELDNGTFTDRRVIDRSRDFAAFKVDLTRYDSPGAKSLRARYGVTGVPEVHFFVPGGGELRAARVIGFLPPGPFLDRMEAVMAAAAAVR